MEMVYEFTSDELDSLQRLIPILRGLIPADNNTKYDILSGLEVIEFILKESGVK
jgi:hypothetical protein